MDCHLKSLHEGVKSPTHSQTMAVPNNTEDIPNNMEDIIFLSYNSTGFNSQRADFLTDITSVLGMSRCFVSLQEHFIMKRNLAKIANLLPNDYIVYNIAAFKDNDQIRRGRGKGGLSQIWHKSVDHLVSRIPVKNCNRVQASLLNLPSATKG